ncbi:MAG: DUF853 family protein [Acidobacteria bacterium]|nr:DUF853 family protein [Acidobacteriota bacterium]
MVEPILIAKTAEGEDIVLLPKMANRHGLITGGEGTGKTYTAFRIVRAFTEQGIPAVMSGTKLEETGLRELFGEAEAAELPALYSKFCLWTLSNLRDSIPITESDLADPTMVIVFDNAELLFRDAPPERVDSFELALRHLRPKGVGVFFVTRDPADIPDKLLTQLGNRIQHALPSDTEKQRKSLSMAAEMFRAAADLDIATAISELGVGEVVVSMLDDKGFSLPPRRATIPAPQHVLDQQAETAAG